MLLLLFFLVAVATSLLINKILLRFSKNLGMRNIDESSIRWASQTKPALGGFSFFFIFLISLLFIVIISDNNSLVTQQSSLGFIAAVFVGFLLGLSDDAYNTKPILKITVQILCGVILVLSNNCIELFNNPSLNAALTVFWIIGIMNSINMLDNMDGIASITSVFICFMMLMLGIYSHNLVVTDMFVLITCIASLLGFLFYNIYPSKLYMGDTGSQFLGVFLGALSIKYVWNIPHHILPQFYSPILVLIVFLLPITDTITVTINRMLKGTSPFVGGRDHTTHYLFFNGFRVSSVFLIFTLISLLSSLIIFITFNYSIFIGVAIAIIYTALIFLTLYLPTRKAINYKKLL